MFLNGSLISHNVNFLPISIGTQPALLCLLPLMGGLVFGCLVLKLSCLQLVSRRDDHPLSHPACSPSITAAGAPKLVFSWQCLAFLLVAASDNGCHRHRVWIPQNLGTYTERDPVPECLQLA